MYDNYNYPLGADNENAPWNQSDQEEIEYDCDVLVTIRKTDIVATTSYIVEDPEYPDYMGGIDLSNVDWKEDYYENCYDVPTMLSKMADLLEKWMPKDLSYSQRREANDLIEQARGWELFETEIEPL